MSLSTTIEAAVETVFKQLDNLAVEVTLVNSSSNAFNFALGEPVVQETTVNTKALVLETKLETGKSFYQKLLLRKAIFETSLYDSIIVNSVTYRVKCIEVYEGAVILEVQGE
jgi:hypothetical protein